MTLKIVVVCLVIITIAGVYSMIASYFEARKHEKILNDIREDREAERRAEALRRGGKYNSSDIKGTDNVFDINSKRS